MPTTLNANALCIVDDVEEYLSEDGVTAYADHENEPADTATSGVIEASINWASNHIYSKMAKRYTAAEVAEKDQAKQWCVILAAWYLCKTKGNPVPKSVEGDKDQVMKDMVHVWDLSMDLV